MTEGLGGRLQSEDTETFLAKVTTGGRLTVNEAVRESLGIEIGDHLRVTVQIDRRKDDETVMVYCESGAHTAELVPHRKENLGSGWARYTCEICNKKTPMKISKAEGHTP